MKRHPTRRSKQGQAALSAFRNRWKRCWFCGAPASAPHHIVFRRGLIFDDERNLAAVCLDCHSRIHGITIVRHDGERLEAIPLLHVLAEKRWRDPGYWDLPFLRELDGRLNYGEGIA